MLIDKLKRTAGIRESENKFSKIQPRYDDNYQLFESLIIKTLLLIQIG